MRKKTRAARTRSYPPLYEKIVPVTLVIIALAIIVLLVVSMSVVLGVFPSV